MSDSINILLEMGFSQQKAAKALSATGNQGVESAMEWLLVHNEDVDVEEVSPQIQTGTEKLADVVPENANQGVETVEVDPNLEVKSYKCLDCNKMFKTDVELEFHAVKSGHQNFTESTEDIRPLSEEEKLEKVKLLEERIKARRLEREDREKKEAIELEKSRRKTGQELAMAKQKMEEEEMRRVAADKKREKMEDKLARQRVLEAIERDKQARREKFGMGGKSDSPVSPLPPQPTVVPQSVPAQPKKEYSQCKLQIRLTNGQAITQAFGSSEELAAVRLYIELNRTDGAEPFSLMTSFPKKVFTEEDMGKPLGALGLVPSAVLIVTKSVV